VFSLLFEVHPKSEQWDDYLGYARMLRPERKPTPKPDNRRRLTPVPAAASEPPMPNQEVPQRRISLLVRFSFKANASSRT
jgi:hypothetical protein